MKTYPVYLNGQFVTTKKTVPIKNPATGEIFANMSMVDRESVTQAIKDAQTAFTSWKTLTAKERGEWLHKIANELERRAGELAEVITKENGKPRTQSDAEVKMTVDHLRWFAEEGRRAYGRIIPHQTEGKRNLVVKSPVGVVGAITPWNFPIMLGARKIAPALAAGCPVILKPASATPICNVIFAEACDAVRLPKGVFQLVMGPSSEIAEEFLNNPLLRKITFTGSTEVGRQLIKGAAATIKPLSLELGGLAPVIVFDDADLEQAVEGTITAKFRNSGQSCVAANRIYVQRGIYDSFVKRFAEQARAMKVGDGMNPQHQVGPLINEEALQQADAYVADAVTRGAKLLCGGKRLAGRGNFFEVTVLAEVPHDALCMKEETFGPIAAITPFDTEEEAITHSNSSDFGLSAYVFTRDLARAFRLMETIECGILGINDGVPTTSIAPFGGVKQSGWGRELGSEGLESFLETKHVSIVL